MEDEGPDPREFLQSLADARRGEHYAYVADAVSDLILDRADVVYVFDLFGNKFLDLSAGDGVMATGHRNALVIDAVTDHIKHHQQTARSGEHVSGKVTEYAKAISDTFAMRDGVPQQVLFCASPDEAMTEAVALAKAVTDRMMTVHLSTDRLQVVLGSGTDTAAVVLELFGPDMVPMDQGWARNVAERAQATGSLVIADERRTGFGRTGSMWAFEQYGLDPDITVLGGAGGGGFPFGAVVAPKHYFDAHRPPQRLFGASPVVCAAGLAVLEQITEPLLEHVKDCGHVFTEAATELAAQFPDIIVGSTGRGLAQAVLCRDEDTAVRFFAEAVRHGLLLRPPQGRAITVTPPLVISESEVRWAVDLMASACLDWVDPL